MPPRRNGAGSCASVARPPPRSPVLASRALAGWRRHGGRPAGNFLAMTLADLGGWPAVLGAVTRRVDLPAASAAAAMTEILEGRATSGQIAAFCIALRMKGETVEELTGLLGAMFEHVTPVVVDEPGRPGRHVRHRRRPQLHHQRLHPGGHGGGRRRRPGVQARQPGPVVEMRVGRPAGGARRGRRPRAGGRGRLRRRGGDGLLLRPPLPPRHAPRRAHPAGAGRADRLQLPRPPGQPGPGAAAVAGRGRPRHGGADAGVLQARGPSGCSWSTATTGWTSSPPPPRRP